MRQLFCIVSILFASLALPAQHFEAGVETHFGVTHTSFRGNLPKMVGFDEIQITEEDVNSAFNRFQLDGPQWLKKAFYDARIEVKGDISRQLTRSVKTVRFFARYRFIGGSFSISDPRLTTPQESRKLNNQLKSVRLALSGKADELAEHLALMAIADETRVKPFFESRYDLEAYVDVKRLFLQDAVLAEWGRNSSIGLNLVGGMRFTADPSPVIDLGNILFVAEKLDELMEGGILNQVEPTTDKIAVALQNVVFGKFRDPRVVPSLGWFARGELPVNFGGSFSILAGAELSVQQHISIKGTQPMFSAYGYAGINWGILSGSKKK